MARQKKVEVVEDEVVNVSLDDFVPDEDTVVKLEDGEESAPMPEMGSPEWTPFVMSKFEQDELAEGGNPTVDGLRRVAELLLGPIVESKSTVVQAPCPQNDNRATVVVDVAIAYGGDMDDKRSFSGAADVYPGNCLDVMFAPYPVAYAETRAEGRALRKHLRLRRVIAAEEASPIPLDETGVNGFATSTQKQVIDNVCKRNNINAAGAIRTVAEKEGFAFTTLENLKYKEAIAVLSFVTDLQRDQKLITGRLSGYQKSWTK